MRLSKITPRKIVSLELAKIIPQKNEMFNLAPAVTNRCALIGIPPWEAPTTNLHSSTLEVDIPWETLRMDVQKRLHIQDQVLKYLRDRKSDQNLAGI